MKSELQGSSKAVERAPRNRAMPAPIGGTERRGTGETGKPKPTERRPNSLSRTILPLLLLAIGYWLFAPARGAIVTGYLEDIGISPMETKITFTPTNAVIVTARGLSAGPPKTVTATNGSFSQVLEGGRYTVCFPLVPSRSCFVIEVPTSTNAVNITNLITTNAITVTFVGNRLLYEEDSEAQGYIQFDP